MARRNRFTFFAVATACLVSAPATALADPVECGTVITADATLDHDLHCSGNGVSIGADNVTLDLNGHTITGPGTSLGYSAVTVQGDHDGVGAENGTLTDYAGGFTPGGGGRETSGHHISNVTVTRTFVAVSLYWTRGARIEDNAFSDFQYAISLNGPTTLDGAQGADESVIRGNGFAGTGTGFFPFNSGSDDNLVLRNRFDQTSGGGILGNRNRVARNSLIGVPGGFGATGDGNVFRANRIQGAGATGLSLSGGDALVTGNTVVGFSLGISASGTHPTIEQNAILDGNTGVSIGDTTAAEVKRNRIRNTLGDGILVPASASGALLERNLVRFSETDDGIQVDSPSTTLTRNEADKNADLGIEAVSGVTDGGGNRAKRNGNPLQCTGVVCR